MRLGPLEPRGRSPWQEMGYNHSFEQLLAWAKRHEFVWVGFSLPGVNPWSQGKQQGWSRDEPSV